MAKTINGKLEDWKKVHEAFGKMRSTTGKAMTDWILEYHQRARAYETKHGEYANPLCRPS